jgi:hypothetical protein
MKIQRFSFLLFCALALTGAAFFSINCAGPDYADGSVGVNITDQPIWGPTGYDRADYYYIPDIDSYYSVGEHQYIYRDGSNWTHAATLPAMYASYDPYSSYKVVVNKDKPYEDNDAHKAAYSKYKGVKDQPVIRDSNDPKYFANKDHPQHAAWVKDQQH